MPFWIRVLFEPEVGRHARIVIRAPQFGWSKEFANDETLVPDWGTNGLGNGRDPVVLEIAARFGPDGPPVAAAIRATHGDGLDIVQRADRFVEARLQHAPGTLNGVYKPCELVCLSTGKTAPGPGCFDCEVGDRVVRVCCQ